MTKIRWHVVEQLQDKRPTLDRIIWYKRMHDIESREDVMKLVDTFYERVKVDPVIKHFFTEVIDIDWQEHMPTMYDFWESMLLGRMSYRGNVMSKHIALDQKSPLQKEHFDRWLTRWIETVDMLFVGDRAEEAKKRAKMTAPLMQYKVEQSRNQHFIQ